MKKNTVIVTGMFLMSVLIGRSILPVNETVQAKPVMVNHIANLPEVFKLPKIETKSLDTINVNIDLATMEIAVKGTNDAIVSVNTTNEPKTIVKWKTKVVTKNTGYPEVKSIGKDLKLQKVSLVEMQERYREEKNR